MEENTISINGNVPDVVKREFEKDNYFKTNKTPEASQKSRVGDFDQHEIPSQFIEKPKFPPIDIDLVSEGYPYPLNHPLSSGKIQIKQPTAYQEDILANEQYIKKGVVLVKLLESLIIDKRIKVSDILTCDTNGIYLAIRRLCYGDSYPIKVKCKSCGNESELDVNLGNFKPNPIDYNIFKKGVNSFEYTLPKSGKNITFKILTQGEEDQIYTEIKAMSKLNKDKSHEFTTKLKYVIQSIDGVEDKGKIRNFIETELVPTDSLELRKYMKKVFPSFPFEMEFTCSSCDFYEERMVVPFTSEFFWPSEQ